MRLKEAAKLQKGDTVTVKRTGKTLTVLDVEAVSTEQNFNNTVGVSVRLSDGKWYGYKQILQ